MSLFLKKPFCVYPSQNHADCDIKALSDCQGVVIINSQNKLKYEKRIKQRSGSQAFSHQTGQLSNSFVPRNEITHSLSNEAILRKTMHF